MPTFEVKKDGRTFEVKAADMRAAAEALSKTRSNFDAPSRIADFFKSIPRGALKGLSDAAGAGGQAAVLEMGQQDTMGDMPGGKVVTEKLEKNVTGEMPKPATSSGRFGETFGEFLGNPASYIGPGGIINKLATATTGAFGSEAGGQLFEGTKAEPYARIIGGGVGATIPRTAARVVTPLPTSPERRAAVNTLRAEGVEPTAGQVTGNRALRYAESELGNAPGSGGATERRVNETNDQFTRAALARVGEVADRATPEVVDRAFRRIGGQFDTLAARNPATFDTQFATEIFNARDNYRHLFVDPLTKPVVEDVIQNQMNLIVRGRQMPGEVYKAQRSMIERMRRARAKDPEVSMFLAEVRDAMDGVMERSIAAANPADLGAWREVRNQYRNMLVIEKAATGAGEQAAAGAISPAKLRQGAVAQGRRQYARGQGDFADLGHAGETILSPLPQSGTAPRALMSGIGATLGATGSAALGHGGAESIIPALAGTMAPGGVGRVLMSGPMQRYLGNQTLADILAQMPTAGPVAARSLPASVGAQQ